MARRIDILESKIDELLMNYCKMLAILESKIDELLMKY